MMDFKTQIRQSIDNKGMKLIFVADRTGIPYQRLNRVFNQDAQMTATELLLLCRLLELDPNDFIQRAS